MKTFFKFTARVLMITIIACVLVWMTMYGWRWGSPYTAELSAEEEVIARRARDIVEVLAAEIGVRSYAYPENLNKAADFIAGRFSGLGFEVTEQVYEARGQTFRNIIADRPGEQKGLPILVIGAHYDTCFNPGANDNASGIAGVLELARLLKDEDLGVRLRFAAFVNEEPPFFRREMGSRHFARRAKAEGENIAGAVIFEMIGYYTNAPFSQKYPPFLGPFYPNRGNFVAFVGNLKSRPFTNTLFESFRHSTDFPVEKIHAPDSTPALNFSDHWSFWKEGFPAFMVTDTAFKRYRHYHSMTDLPDELNYEHMARVIGGLKKALLNYQ